MTCKHCGDPLLPGQMDFCSEKCADEYMARRIVSEEQRRQMTDAFNRWLTQQEEIIAEESCQDNRDGMTVGELMERLKSRDQSQKVIFCDTDEGLDKEINGIFEEGGRVYLYDILPCCRKEGSK